MSVHPFVLSAMRGRPVEVEDHTDPLTAEEFQMLRFIEGVDRLRNGEPHDLTPEQVGDVNLARADAWDLAEALAYELAEYGPDADPEAVLDEFFESHGGHEL